jgi:acyl carrier protein phosphodiesterase
MNFLAHALLAGDTPSLIVGGVVGDWIKGPLPARLPPDLARGVALHRAIDAFSERHAAFRCSRARLSGERRRYAGVLVDIYYDHLLARDWPHHHDETLETFCSRVYELIAARLDELPDTAQPVLKRMADEDWLGSYTSMAGIADVLERMSRRARAPNPLAGGERELQAGLAAFQADFTAFLPDARYFAREWQALDAQ